MGRERQRTVSRCVVGRLGSLRILYAALSDWPSPLN
jgi:hypothetical protein